MAYSFRDEFPVLGPSTTLDDPVTASNALPKVVGSFAISIPSLAAASAVSDAIWVAPYAVQVIGVRVRFRVAGGAAAAVTVEKTPSATAPGSGTALLTATLALTGAANTNASGTLLTNSNTLQLAAGDALSYVLSGTLTGLAGLAVTITLQKV